MINNPTHKHTLTYDLSTSKAGRWIFANLFNYFLLFIFNTKFAYILFTDYISSEDP